MDDDKKSESTEGVYVSKKERWHFSSLSQRARRLLFIGLIAIVVVGLGVAAYIWWSGRQNASDTKVDKSVAFVIGDKTYSKEDVRALVAYPVANGLSEDDAVDSAFAYLTRRAAADQVGITLPEAEVQAAAKSAFSSDVLSGDAQRGWVNLVSYDTVLTTRLQGGRATDAKGYVFVFPFDQYVPGEDPGANAQLGITSEEDSVARTAEAKTYAKQQADGYRTHVTDGSQMPDATLAAIKADAKLQSYPGSLDSNQSVRFDGFIVGDVSRPERYIARDAQDDVFALARTKATGEVKLGYRYMGEHDETKTESYYYFVMIDSAASSVVDTESFNKALSDIKASAINQGVR